MSKERLLKAQVGFSPNFLFNDRTYVEQRNQRAKIAIYITTFMLVFMSLLWASISYNSGNFLLVFFDLLFFVISLTAIFVTSNEKIQFGASIILITSLIYISTAQYIEGIHLLQINKTSYFLIINLMFVQFFSHSLNKYFTIFYSLVCFIILIFSQTSIFEVKSLSQVVNNYFLEECVQCITPVSVAIFIVIMSLLLINEIHTCENDYSIANSTLNMILKNMLPEEVADRLQREGKTFAEGFTDCTVLFANVMLHLEYKNIVSGEEIDSLKHIFEDFEEVTEKLGLEKIKTVGSTFMVVSGAPKIRSDHAEKAVELALLFQLISEKHKLPIRIGVNSGPLVAGIIGRTRYVYDLWGDTVNVASRMEVYGQKGKIHISLDTKKLLGQRFKIEERDPLYIKGKGIMHTFFVTAQEIPKKYSIDIKSFTI